MKKLSLLLFFIQLASIFSATIAQEAECSREKECKKGCCSKFGYCGLGKDFCAPENCLNNCNRKAECDPGSFGKEYVEAEKCPLNICCSKHGFCGTTKEFCGSQTVKKPSECSTRRKFNRVVGYYESWAMSRYCNAFNPEKIPIGVYTHLNFAFASINPTTFEVRPESDQDISMYKRMMSLKKRDPDLKILIAIGGWTFNDPGPTATTFSDIASSEANQKKFLKSLISFMSTYGFDGLDLDWEYPGAKDRSGRDVDFKNFPKFLSNIKQALKASGRDTLSITIPASLWYLKHFDIKAMEPYVDFFNVMSYDLHGTWDLKNDWVGPYLNAHTNLTEIDDALDLLWRNDISPDKVVMGLAFYGRAFRLEDPSCTEPGCRYGSGAPKQPCSNEVSVILNSEIADVMNTTGAKPKLYEKEAVKVITWDNNWVAYDDEETLKKKAEFAAKRCLSGVMVWAVSHDTKDAKYSLALAQFAPRDHVLVEKPQDGNTTTYTSHDQCKWTNCREGCPSGWSTIKRSDDNARTNEIMQDGQGCDGYGVHTLCCPPGNGLPKCGWYGHRNGDCSGVCPTGAVPVATNNQHCYRTGMIGLKGYQTACCSIGNGLGSHTTTWTSMKLHSQCEWGVWPYCDDGKCTLASKNDLVSLSKDGSGGAVCMVGKQGYCCNNGDENWKWESCEWYKDYGDGPEGSKNCKPGCPSNKVRISMESTTCKNGAWAYCCSPKARTLETRSNPMLKIYEDALRTFLKDPTCPANYEATIDGLLVKKGTLFGSTQGNTTSSSGLIKRSSTTTIVKGVEDVVDVLRDDFVSLDVTNLWNDIMGARWRSLTAANVHEFFNSDPYSLVAIGGFSIAVTYFVCNINSINSWMGGDKNDLFTCTSVRKLCVEDYWEIPTISGNAEIKWQATEKGTNAVFSGSYKKLEVPSGNQWDANDPVEKVMYQNVYNAPDRNCQVINLKPKDMLADRLQGRLKDTETEHPIEGQTVRDFYQDGIKGKLANGKDATHSLPGDFITGTLQDSSILGRLNPPPDPPRGYSKNTAVNNVLQRRLLNALGSMQNRGVLVLAWKELNCIKEKLWEESNPVSPDTLKTYLTTDTADADILLTEIRNAVGVFAYLNDKTLHTKMINIIMEFRKQLRLAERAHLLRTGVRVQAVPFFDEWMPTLLARVRQKMVDFATYWCDELEKTWQGIPQGQGVIKQCTDLKASATAMVLNTQGFYDPV